MTETAVSGIASLRRKLVSQKARCILTIALVGLHDLGVIVGIGSAALIWRAAACRLRKPVG